MKENKDITEKVEKIFDAYIYLAKVLSRFVKMVLEERKVLDPEGQIEFASRLKEKLLELNAWAEEGNTNADAGNN